jgi:peptidoglycan-associated lipoprotein
MNLRLRHFVVIPLFVLAIGCSSTSGRSPVAAEPNPPKPAAPAASEVESSASSDLSIAEDALAPVHFATDDASLQSAAREKLAESARTIVQHPEWGMLTIEGHCDERGSHAYNQALGDRRARAVERYLVERGVPAERLQTRSIGDTRPAVIGHDESAWRFNRRSELQIEAMRTAGR